MSSSDLLSPIITRLNSMPPVQALQLRIESYSANNLRLAAPLNANINDKGNAFGGSLASVMTLSAWALVSAKLMEAGFNADVYVQDSTLRYLAPLYDDLVSEARLSNEESWETLIHTFSQRGKARATLSAEIRAHDGTVCCTLEGRFVAMKPKV